MESHSTSNVAEVRALGGDVVLVICDVQTRLRTPPKLETLSGTTPSPLMSLRVPLAAGGTRVLWAFRRRADADLVFRAFAGVLAAATFIEIPRLSQHPPADLAAMVAELEPAGRVSLVAALLGVWSTAFRLRRDPALVHAVHKLASALAPSPTTAKAQVDLGDGLALFRTPIPATFGDVQAGYVVSPRAITYLPGRWRLERGGQGAGDTLHIVAPRDLGPADRILIVGANGIAVRRPAVARSLPSLAGWWRGAKAATGLPVREFLIRALAEASPAGRAASIEFQLGAPLRPRALRGRGGLPSLNVTLALTGPSGLLVAGWLLDPSGLISHLEVEDEAGAAPLAEWHRFPMQIGAGPRKIDATGFVGFSKAGRAEAPLLQPRLRVVLASGLTHSIVPRLQSADPAVRRAQALRAVPPQYLTDEVIAGCVGPAVHDLQHAFLKDSGAPAVETIGEGLARPRVSVIVPLYRNLEFLAAQVGAFAADPDFREDAEIIYVLDSPEQAADVRQHLQGLNLLYGLPFTLVVMARNAGYAPASNAGAAAARGDVLVMLNSDVVPARPGWVATVAPRLFQRRYGIAGPKLLFDDDSIQHAGMFFARNQFGHWLNHHFHKGMPRDFAPATVERSVPAVTGACLFIRRDLFEAIGGFTEDYVIGDYEDSDLCLKARKAGSDIVYVPEAELYHFERQSIRRNEDYMRGSADRCNAWLHAGRWGEAMAALMRVPADGPTLRAAA